MNCLNRPNPCPRSLGKRFLLFYSFAVSSHALILSHWCRALGFLHVNSIANTSKIAFFSANFWWIFFRISRQIPENSDVCRFFNQICENKSEICRKFWILWKKFTIISELFTSLLRCGFRIRTSTSRSLTPSGGSSTKSSKRSSSPERRSFSAAWRLATLRRSILLCLF